jgi:hypothetical protein
VTDTLYGASVPGDTTTDTDLDPVTVGTVVYVRGGDTGWTARGIRQLTGTGGLDLSGCWAYLYGLGPTELLAVKQFPTDLDEGAWNEVLLDSPVNLTEFPAGRMYVACVYLPAGGFAFRISEFGTNVFGVNDNLVGPEAGDVIANGPAAGNGVFLPGTIADPSDPPPSPTFQATINNTWYGVDWIVQDPATAPPEPPTNTVAPAITGLPHVGRPLACTTGSWFGTQPITYERQWERDGDPIGDATFPTYVVTNADVGHEITCVVTATNSVDVDTATSNAVEAQEAPAPPGANVIRRVLRNGSWFQLQYGYAGLGLITRPESFGARRDGETDDTEAIATCIAAALEQAISDRAYYVKVEISPGVYLIDGVPTVGGATLGNAQIPIPPIVPEDEQLIILDIQGCGVSTPSHWAAQIPNAVGSVFRSTAEGLSVNPTYGAPSIIGGPTVDVGSNPLAPYFSNLHVRIDGVTVMAPMNPGLVGLDLRSLKATIGELTTTVNATPSELITEGISTNDLGVALMMPSPGNNAICNIGNYTATGWNCPLVISEHTVVQQFLALFFDVALFINSIRDTSTNHASTIQYMCAEAGNTVVKTDEQNNIKFGLDIAVLDTEITDTGTHIHDPTNMLHGRIQWHDYQATRPRVNGGENLRIIDLAQDRGAVVAPAVPAAATPFRNPFWRDAMIYFSEEATLELNGQEITRSDVFLPTGQTIEFSDPPAGWGWNLH